MINRDVVCNIERQQGRKIIFERNKQDCREFRDNACGVIQLANASDEAINCKPGQPFAIAEEILDGKLMQEQKETNKVLGMGKHHMQLYPKLREQNESVPKVLEDKLIS